MGEDLLDLFHRRVPPKLQPVTERLYHAAKASFFASLRGDLPARARAQLLGASLRILANRPPRRDVAVALPGGRVFLGAESYEIDALTLGYIWGQRAFPLACRGRVVIDLGAHKGYFSAWALAQGAAHVYSYEPQSTNFGALVRAQLASRRPGAWSCEHAAVGRSKGVAQLFISNDSWAHSLHGDMVDAVSVEEVPMVTLPDVMRRVIEDHPGADVALKVNVEGAAGEILFPASPEDLAPIVQIDLDHEPGSPYAIDSLLGHLQHAGLGQVRSVREKLFMVERSSASERSAPRLDERGAWGGTTPGTTSEDVTPATVVLSDPEQAGR